MKRFVAVALIATPMLTGCPATPAARNTTVVNADDGKHYISALGKWKYGNVMAPSRQFPQCHWEIWGLHKTGWKKLYEGKGLGKVELPPEGVYGSAYLLSKNCGAWHVAKEKK